MIYHLFYAPSGFSDKTKDSISRPINESGEESTNFNSSMWYAENASLDFFRKTNQRYVAITLNTLAKIFLTERHPASSNTSCGAWNIVKAQEMAAAQISPLGSRTKLVISFCIFMDLSEAILSKWNTPSFFPKNPNLLIIFLI